MGFLDDQEPGTGRSLQYLPLMNDVNQWYGLLQPAVHLSDPKRFIPF